MATFLVFENQLGILKGLINYLDRSTSVVMIETMDKLNGIQDNDGTVYIPKSSAKKFIEHLKQFQRDAHYHAFQSDAKAMQFFKTFFKKKRSKKVFVLPSLSSFEEKFVKTLEKELRFKRCSKLQHIFEKHLKSYESWIKHRMKNALNDASNLLTKKFNILIDEYGDPLDGFIEAKFQETKPKHPYSAFIGKQHPNKKLDSSLLQMPCSYLNADFHIQYPFTHTIAREKKPSTFDFDKLLKDPCFLIEWLFDEPSQEIPKASEYD
ncbi:MAG: hypothetical protein K940chlam8_00024 [Chlamydiae bacterium]|nr:hypothetical protein [Chlamydiota bacterium]